MARKIDTKTRRKQAKRYARFAKQAQKPVEEKLIEAGTPGAFALKKRKEQEEVKPPKGKAVRSKTRTLVIGGRKPESAEEVHKAERPPLGHETLVERIEVLPGGQTRKVLFEGKSEDVPEVIPGSMTEEGRVRKESLAEQAQQKGEGDVLETKARTYETVDPEYRELEARRKALGLRMPDKLITTRRRAKKGEDTRVRTKTKFFGDIPEEEIEAAKEREMSALAGGKEDVTLKVKGRKIIEKRRTADRPTLKQEAARKKTLEAREKARARAAATAEARKKAQKKAKKSAKRQ